MRKLWEIIKVELKIDLQYTFAFMISVLVQPIIMFMSLALFTSVYTYNDTDMILGYKMIQMIWYFTCVHFMWVILFNFADMRISDKVLSGDLNIDLLRPVSLFKYELGNAIGLRLMALFVEFLPGLFVYSLIVFPRFLTPISILRFIAVIPLAFLIMYMLNFLTGLSAFKLQSNTSITGIKAIFISILGGGAMPLEFFPDSIQNALRFLPFEYMFYWPIQFFLNTDMASGTTVFLKIISIQAFWAILLFGICKFAWTRVSRDFSAVG